MTRDETALSESYIECFKRPVHEARPRGSKKDRFSSPTLTLSIQASSAGCRTPATDVIIARMEPRLQQRKSARSCARGSAESAAGLSHFGQCILVAEKSHVHRPIDCASRGVRERKVIYIHRVVAAGQPAPRLYCKTLQPSQVGCEVRNSLHGGAGNELHCHDVRGRENFGSEPLRLNRCQEVVNW